KQLSLFVVDSSGVARENLSVASLSKSYQKILEAFPPGSRFSSEELYDKIRCRNGKSQRHARRRWKELKYDYGFEVDYDGSRYWRGNSDLPINYPMVRPDDKKLREAFWNTLAEKSKQLYGDTLPHCEYCDARVVP